MNKHIRTRILELGGSINSTETESVIDSLLSLKLECPLYEKPAVLPWSSNPEPINGLNHYVGQNIELYKSDKDMFFKNMVSFFYEKPDDNFGQTYFTPKLFTPLTKGTPDYDEWGDWFDEDVNLEIFQNCGFSEPLEFVELTCNDGYPDTKFICISDPEPENPRVFGTDHELFFIEVSKEGRLEDFFNKFMSQKEFMEIVVSQMKAHYH